MPIGLHGYVPTSLDAWVPVCLYRNELKKNHSSMDSNWWSESDYSFHLELGHRGSDPLCHSSLIATRDGHQLCIKPPVVRRFKRAYSLQSSIDILTHARRTYVSHADFTPSTLQGIMLNICVQRGARASYMAQMLPYGRIIWRGFQGQEVLKRFIWAR